MPNAITESKRCKSKEEQEFWDEAFLSALSQPSEERAPWQAQRFADEAVDLRRTREFIEVT